MHVYATGMNPADSNSLKRAPRVALFQAVNPVMQSLRDQGHQLTWRATKVGDQLPVDIDAIFASVMLPRSLNCPYSLGVMWTLYKALRDRIPLVIYMTDWAFASTHTEFKSIHRQGQSYFSKKIGGVLQYNEDPEMIERYGDCLLEICNQWADPKSFLWEHAQVAVPRYTNWGDIKIVQRMMPGANPIHTYDPTPAFLAYLDANPKPYAPWPMERRHRQWILPSLLNDDYWINRQGLKWNVVRFGPKKFVVVPDEWAVQAEYCRNVGAICTPYPHEGSGWWRSRWIHSARAKSILFCGTEDARQMGRAFMNSGPAYENTSMEMLAKIAEVQAHSVNSVLQRDPELFAEQVIAPFKAAGA